MATIDYSKVYDEYNKAKDFELQQQATALQKQVDEYSAQKNKINQNYTDAANTAYTNARLTSRGRAENLAAMGLGRGYYDDPTSGYAERQINRADSDLRNTLGKIDLEKAGKLTDVDNYISQVQAAAKANGAGIESSYAQKIAALQKEEADARAQFELQQRQAAAQVAAQAAAYAQAAREKEISEAQSAYKKAKAQYILGNYNNAFETIYNALPEDQRDIDSMALALSDYDHMSDHVYELKNWWYNKNSSNFNGWGMR